MAAFDFITNRDFRTSLEADYRELELCMKAEAWKAVHVLAGSIIEALLIDSLQSSGYSGCSEDALLRMELNQVISVSRTEGILSQKAADLSSVIRSYRNLIHPGRLIRLDEVVDQNGAVVAKTLVEMITDEVAAKKRTTYGYTAEQIVKKLEKDSSSLSIIGHLLKEVKTYELERLLLDAIPSRYLSLDESKVFCEEYNVRRIISICSTLSGCFRAAFSTVSDDIKKKVVQKFVSILKQEQESTVLIYETVFFRASDLAYLSADDANLVKGHIRGRLQVSVDDDMLTALSGIGAFLTPQDVNDLLDPIIKAAVRDEEAKHFLITEYTLMSTQISIAVLQRLKQWHYTYEQKRLVVAAESIGAIIQELEFDESDPFADE
jgi:hypothetical protein